MKRQILSFTFMCIMMFTTACGTGPVETDLKNSKDTVNTPDTVDEEDLGIVLYVGGNIFDSSLDPVKGAMSYGYSFTNCALTRVNTDSEYEGDLATSWEISNDSLTYTFHLREGIKFHDGSDFTAEDVVFTYETVKNNQGNNENVDLTKLVSIKAKNDYRVEFTLSEPYSPFFDTVAALGIVPSDSYDSETFDQYPIGTGPWNVVQYNTSGQIIVEANEEYYEGAPEIKKVTFLNMDNEAAFSGAKSGELDVVMVGANYSEETVEGMHLEKLETMDVRNISLVCIPEKTVTDSNGKEITVGNNVTSDIAVRKALSVGLDRNKVIENASNGVGKPAWGFTENLVWGNPTNTQDNQREDAIRILEEAGWVDSNGDGIREKDEIDLEFELYTPSTDQERYLLATAVAENVKELGISIIVKQGTWDELEGKVHTAGILWGWGQYSPLVLNSLLYSEMFLVGPYDNVVGYSNQAVDTFIQSAINAKDQEEAVDNWKEAQSIAAQDYPYLYIVNIEHCYFINDSIDISVESQIPHPHGHGAPVICNMKDWTYR